MLEAAEGLSSDSDSIDDDDLRSVDAFSSTSSDSEALEWEDAKEIEIDTVDNESVLRLPGMSFRTPRPSGTGSNFKSHRNFKQSIKSYTSYKKSLAEYKGINKQSLLLSKSGKQISRTELKLLEKKD